LKILKNLDMSTENPKTEQPCTIDSVSHSNFIDTKVEIVEIDERLSIHFIYVPEGYNISKLSLSDHETKVIGRLKQFNRIKMLENWKKDNVNLVKVFTNILEKRGWDFNKFPNPIAYATSYCG
jgi:hypothetical protein